MILLQIRIVDKNGNTKASYTYNSWGEILNTYNAENCNIGTLNPIRYRGYYYDAELNMYYLQSRYYDPVVKRMLCVDDPSTILLTGDGLNDTNLFAYCFNSPIEYKDDEEDIPVILIEMVWNGGVELATQLLETRDIKKVKWGETTGAEIYSGLSMGFSQSLQLTKVGMTIGSLACDAIGELSANLFVNAAQGQSAGENLNGSINSAGRYRISKAPAAYNLYLGAVFSGTVLSNFFTKILKNKILDILDIS